jgi:hypothetical protein
MDGTFKLLKVVDNKRLIHIFKKINTDKILLRGLFASTVNAFITVDKAKKNNMRNLIYIYIFVDNKSISIERLHIQIF